MRRTAALISNADVSRGGVDRYTRAVWKTKRTTTTNAGARAADDHCLVQ